MGLVAPLGEWCGRASGTLRTIHASACPPPWCYARQHPRRDPSQALTSTFLTTRGPPPPPAIPQWSQLDSWVRADAGSAVGDTRWWQGG